MKEYNVARGNRQICAMAFVVGVFCLQFGCFSERQRAEFREQRREIESAIQRFHQQLNSGEDQEIYQEATVTFRHNSTEAAIENSFQKLRHDLGKARSFKIVAIEPHVAPGATEYFVRCYSEFDKGQAIETFFLLWQAHQTQLDGYHIRSDAISRSQSSPGSM